MPSQDFSDRTDGSMAGKIVACGGTGSRVLEGLRRGRRVGLDRSGLCLMTAGHPDGPQVSSWAGVPGRAPAGCRTAEAD